VTRWRDDLPDEWEDASRHPPTVDPAPVDPYLLGVDVDELVVDLGDRR